MKTDPYHSPASPPRSGGPGPGTGVGTAPGTFGELLQGELQDPREAFLVTLPIEERSVATFQPRADLDDVVVRPACKLKSREVARRILADNRRAGGGILSIRSSLPEGKGLASSSADLVATARAVAASLGRRLSASDIEDCLRPVEPSDGVMYDEVVAFFHRRVRLRARFGFLPPATVVGIDLGGTVDTVRFNRVRQSPRAAVRREYQGLLERLQRAVAAGDLAAVGEISTRSAELSLSGCFPAPRDLEPARRLCAALGGVGIVTAHSGTMVGTLIDGRPDPEIAARARAVLGCEDSRLFVYRTVAAPGGDSRREPAHAVPNVPPLVSRETR
ncbi:kinase [Streptomyces sp. NPDC046985]|uniref:GHMP family kinase ATP-binding protein n=1 Tax=Streptomyces sp. NPDC046985 TaxID=3155377 RepID=UPI0033E7BD13